MTDAPASAARPAALPVQCTVVGEKLFAPPQSAEAICARFVATLGRGIGRPVARTVGQPVPRDRLVVALRFLPRGMASAQATRVRGSRVDTLPLYELAVSDRRFVAADVDLLARQVIEGIGALPR